MKEATAVPTLGDLMASVVPHKLNLSDDERLHIAELLSETNNMLESFAILDSRLAMTRGMRNPWIKRGLSVRKWKRQRVIKC